MTDSIMPSSPINAWQILWINPTSTKFADDVWVLCPQVQSTKTMLGAFKIGERLTYSWEESHPILLAYIWEVSLKYVALYDQSGFKSTLLSVLLPLQVFRIAE